MLCKKKKKLITKNVLSRFEQDLNVPFKVIKDSVNGFVNDCFNNELLFFKWELSTLDTLKVKKNLFKLEFLYSNSVKNIEECAEYKSYSKKLEENFDNNLFEELENYLLSLELLEFVYLLKTKEKYYLLIAVKSLVGYNSSLLDNYRFLLYKNEYLFSSKINHMKDAKQVKKYFYYLIVTSQAERDLYFSDNVYSFRSFHVKQAIGKLYTQYFVTSQPIGEVVDIYNDIVFMEINEYCLRTNIFKKLIRKRNDEVSEQVIFGSTKKEDILSLDAGQIKYNMDNLANDFKVISVKKSGVQSVINLWVVYMKLNNLCYKDGKIYEKVMSNNKFEFKFVSELNYLKVNMDIIIYFLKQHFYQQLLTYPLELKVMPYLEEAYLRVLSSPYYYLPDESELENVFFRRFSSLYDLIDKYRGVTNNMSSYCSKIGSLEN